MVEINDFREEKACTYKDEEYLVRDNGAVLRKARPNQRTRKLDNEWTFGKLNDKTGYLEIASIRVHRIVATAFHGDPPTSEHIVDHIDTNRRNNRPDNLRWITRLENVVLNEVTRKRIEYRTGVSIDKFLEDPAKYRDLITDPDFSWMKRVSKEEAYACLENINRWRETKNTSSSKKIGEWIFKKGTRNISSSMEAATNGQVNSLSKLARQRNWNTPTRFVCCPDTLEENPLETYYNNMSVGGVFEVNQYDKKSSIYKFAFVEDKIIVITDLLDSGIKNFGLVEITFDDGYFVHTSIKTFFTEEGAEKQFTLAQGLEWTGEDSIDDYC